jgi:hypothetical protein
LGHFDTGSEPLLGGIAQLHRLSPRIWPMYLPIGAQNPSKKGSKLGQKSPLFDHFLTTFDTGSEPLLGANE